VYVCKYTHTCKHRNVSVTYVLAILVQKYTYVVVEGHLQFSHVSYTHTRTHMDMLDVIYYIIYIVLEQLGLRESRGLKLLVGSSFMRP
jgi:hypothetical protein